MDKSMVKRRKVEESRRALVEFNQFFRILLISLMKVIKMMANRMREIMKIVIQANKIVKNSKVIKVPIAKRIVKAKARVKIKAKVLVKNKMTNKAHTAVNHQLRTQYQVTVAPIIRIEMITKASWNKLLPNSKVKIKNKSNS
jgi:hypothetical protein